MTRVTEHRRQACGFTLVELSVAMAIAACLTVCALGVVTAMATSAKAHIAAQGQEQVSSFRELLRADLELAEKCRPLLVGFELQTLDSLDRRTMEHRHRPCRVTYEVRRLSGRCWLVRTQDSTVSGKRWTEVISADVSSIDLKGMSPSADFRSIPASVVVTLTRGDPPTSSEMQFRLR